jgi:hypothetical protein
LRSLWLAPCCGALITLWGCTTLPVIEANQCGNAVIEHDAGEDCDTFVAPEDKGAVCRPPGVIGECHFDCRPNADGTRPPCPDGRGCAPDGICRDWTHDFQLPKQNLSADVSSWLAAADFDGDGRADVISAEPADQVQQARFRLHYFDADTKLVETRTFPAVTTRPVARQITGDGAAELVFSNFRIGMLKGRADREWIPATFSSYVVPRSALRIAPVSDSPIGESLGLVAFTSLDVDGIFVPSGLAGRLTLLERLTHPILDLAGTPLGANVVEGPDSPCAEVVFAFKGDDSFRVLDVCEVVVLAHSDIGWRTTPRSQVVQLPAGSKIDSGPVAADVDGDGHLDILIGAGGYAFLARGDGQKLEARARPLNIARDDEDEAAQLRMPLAAGDITGDGRADFVEADRVLGSRVSPVDGSLHYFTSFQNNAQPWSLARVEDLNGNELPDVIAATEGAPGLSFLSGTGGPYPVPARLGTQGPVRLLATGDYDGDLIADIALVESGPPKHPSDSLAVAYGSRDRVPLAPLRIAELAGVEQLGSQRDASVDDIFTASSEVVDGEQRSTFTLFGGTSDRLPFAPYTLVNFAKDGSLLDWSAEALLVGSFTGRGTSDVVALGTHDLEKGWNQWLIPDIGSSKTPPLQLGDGPSELGPYTKERIGVRLSVASVAADLDHDGVDEAVWLMPRGPSACSLLINAVKYDAVNASGEMIVESQVDFDEPCATPELTASDLNQNGATHLLALMGDPAIGPRRLEIFWNDGAGGFSADARSVVGSAKQDIRAFSVFPAPYPRIAFVTESSLLLATTSSDARQFDDLRQIKTTFDDARSVVVTDPNGDGIPDIVVADAEGLWLLGAQLR